MTRELQQPDKANLQRKTERRGEIYILGDTHGDYTKFIPAFSNLNNRDIVIVCGDFGMIYYHDRRDTAKIELLSTLECTIAFADGNHENFNAIQKYPEEVWNKGIVHRISKNIVHLKRGYVYNIEGNEFFVFGGGYSRDKSMRTEGIDFWKQEMPSIREYMRGIVNLMKTGFKVDYIITHTAPIYATRKLGMGNTKEDLFLRIYLEIVRRTTSFSKWFFGHYHIDREITDKLYAVYKNLNEC